MKVSWIKYKKDNESFKIPQKLGLDVFNLKNPEETDFKIEELVKNDYKMIVVSNEIAGFSENIIKKYNFDKRVNIIIANAKE